MSRRVKSSVASLRNFIVAVVAGIGLLMAGHGSALADTGDESFLLTLDHFGVPYGTPANGITMGHGACRILNAGEDWQSAIMDVSNATGLTILQSGYVIGAAVPGLLPAVQVGNAVMIGLHGHQ
jgi:hypothetical protein